MSKRIRKYALPVAIAAAIVVCLYAFNPNFQNATGPRTGPYAGDFLQEWIGGWIVRAGDHGRFYDVEYAQRLEHNPELVGFRWNADEYLPIVYPPFYYAIVSPLSLFSVRTAAWIWSGLMVAGLAASLILLLRYAQRQRTSYPFRRRRNVDADETPDAVCTPSAGRRRSTTGNDRCSDVAQLLPWLIPAAVFFAPVLESLSSSQKGTLCLLIFTATFVLWQRRRAFTAGMIFGLIAFKPQLALVLAAVAVWKRQWRFVGGLATTCAALLGGSLTLGFDVGWQYVQFALGTGEYMQTSGYDLHKSHSIWGFASLLMPRAAGGMRMCFSLLLAALVAYQLARILREKLSPGSDRFPLQFSSLVVATVLLSPHLFTYDLSVLLLPMALAVFRQAAAPASSALGSGLRRNELWVVGLLYVSPAISTALAASVGVQLTVPLLLGWLSALAQGSEVLADDAATVARAAASEAPPAS